MERLVIIRGESAEWLIDLEKNPDIEERIEAGELHVVRELKTLPPDPWAKKAAKTAEGEPAGEKPLEKMNHDELAVVVEAEQVDLGDASTKKEIADKIEEARVAKASAPPAEVPADPAQDQEA